MEHLFVKFGDPSCVGFVRYRLEKQTDVVNELSSVNMAVVLPDSCPTMYHSRSASSK